MTHQTFTLLSFFGYTLRKQHFGKIQRQENLCNQTILKLKNYNIRIIPNTSIHNTVKQSTFSQKIYKCPFLKILKSQFQSSTTLYDKRWHWIFLKKKVKKKERERDDTELWCDFLLTRCLVSSTPFLALLTLLQLPSFSCKSNWIIVCSEHKMYNWIIKKNW